MKTKAPGSRSSRRRAGRRDLDSGKEAGKRPPAPPAQSSLRPAKARGDSAADPPAAWTDMTRSIVFGIDTDKRLTFANKRLAQWAGLPIEAIRSQPLEQVLGTAACRTLLAHLEMTLDGGKAHFTGLLVLKDGSSRMVEAHMASRAMPAGGIEAVVVIEDDTDRWLVSAALQEREERLREILHRAADGIVTIDTGGRIDSFNAAAERIFGFKAGEVVGENVSRLMPAPDRSTHDIYLARYQETGKGKIIGIGPRRVTGLRKDGTEVPLDLAVSEARPGGNRIFIGILRDVTDQVRVETALAASESRFRAFAESASDWFWEQDSELRLTYVSEAFSSRWPEVTAAAMGRRIEQMPDADFDPDTLHRHLDDIAARKPFRSFRFRVRGGDQAVRILSISGVPQFDSAGTFRGYRGAGRDVTEEVEAELRAHRADRRLAAALAVMPEALALFDATGQRVLENASYREMLGSFATTLPSSAGGLHGQCAGICGICAEPDSCLAERMLLHRLRAGGRTESAMEIQQPGGRWFQLREHRLPHGDVAVVALDITELKLRETALDAARSAAEAANAAKSAFLAHMSHELRTPLNAIIGFAEVLMGQVLGPITSERYGEYFGDIYRSGRHLLDLINQLLDMAKIESGNLELTEEEFDLADVAREAVSILRDQFAAKKLELQTPLGDEVALRADRRAVKQSIINLLSNAMKFTEAGGRVSLGIGHRADGSLEVSVADTGIGIPAGKLDYAFKPFAQIDADYARVAGGTGLGLAITKSLVEHQGGRVEIKSEVGAGTTVRLVFPPERSLQPQVPAAVAPAAKDITRY